MAGGTPLVEVRIGRAAGDERARSAELVLGLAAGLAPPPPGRLRLGHEADGRPVVRGAAVHVSVSHGRGVLAAAASTDFPVGVDVEAVRRIPVRNLARRWLRAAEAEWIERREPDERIVAFLWLWTQKEALGKARGLGLAGGAGLSRAVWLPESWPPSGRDLMGERGVAWLGPVPGDARLAVAAGFADGVVFAAAAQGANAVGAIVRTGPADLDGAHGRGGQRGQVADTA
ncbi:MAG TPA: 4'-phosphopantetheinyl transferase superfamily protein [Actinocrinis sp.]|nr:4'-phosphopantetheinyl transferase superfamily protein [Actinocrinis sp.]